MVRDEYRDGMTLQDYADRWVDMAPHLEQLKELASVADSIVEFGIRGAVSSWALLDGLSKDGTLVSVDIDPECPIPYRVKRDPRFTFIVGDDREVELPERADLVMIDSSHTYEHTCEELILAAKMEPKVIALHDYNDPVVGFMVKPAIDEFAANPDNDYYLETVYPSTWGLAILRRGEDK